MFFLCEAMSGTMKRSYDVRLLCQMLNIWLKTSTLHKCRLNMPQGNTVKRLFKYNLSDSIKNRYDNNPGNVINKLKNNPVFFGFTWFWEGSCYRSGADSSPVVSQSTRITWIPHSSLYTAVVLFFFSFFSKTSASEGERRVRESDGGQ